MECKNVNKKLIFYIDDKLPLDETLEIQKHLNECEQCNAKYEFLKQILSQIEADRDIRPNDFIATRILAKLPATEKKYKLKKVLSPVLIAIFMFFAIILGKLTADFYYTNELKNQVEYVSKDNFDQYVIEELDYTSYYYVENQ